METKAHTAEAALGALLSAFEGRRRREAAAMLGNLVQSGAPLGQRWAALSRLGMAIGEVELALAASRAWMSEAPRDPQRRLSHAALLARIGRVEEALVDLEDLPELGQVEHLRGTLHAQLGDNALAKEHLARAARTLPPEQAAWTWLAMSDLKRFDRGDKDADTIKTLLREPISDIARSAAYYAMGKALLDQDDADQAFAHYSNGAAIMARLEPDDQAHQSRFVSQLVNEFDQRLFDDLKPSACLDTRPIFVLGPPRSGTTLVEQILTSHSAVASGAELSLFTVAAMSLPDFSVSAITRHNATADPDPWGTIGLDYLHLLRQRFGDGGRIVDKTLNHGRVLGLLAHVFPKARFIWLDRDIGDIGWSCFRTRFASSMAWTWSLESIGRYLADEARLRAHWRDMLSERLLLLRYEDLVSDPEVHIRRILAHAGLPDEAAPYRPHLTRRAVQTASVSQVREAIHTKSVGLAKEIRGRLEPMYQAYEAGLERSELHRV